MLIHLALRNWQVFLSVGVFSLDTYIQPAKTLPFLQAIHDSYSYQSPRIRVSVDNTSPTNDFVSAFISFTVAWQTAADHTISQTSIPQCASFIDVEYNYKFILTSSIQRLSSAPIACTITHTKWTISSGTSGDHYQTFSSTTSRWPAPEPFAFITAYHSSTTCLVLESTIPIELHRYCSPTTVFKFTSHRWFWWFHSSWRSTTPLSLVCTSPRKRLWPPLWRRFPVL